MNISKAILFISCLFIIQFGLNGRLLASVRGQHWEIKAQKITFYHDSKVVIGQGSVEIRKESLKVFAQKVIYDAESKKIYAAGDVVINMDEDILRGSKGVLDLDTSTGKMENAFLYLKRNNIHLTASKMAKIGPEEYKAQDATVSTCPLPGQDWRFRCKELRLTVDGEAKANNAFFEIKDIPVFYTPILFAPINRYRKTGFLLPEFKTSTRNGFGVNVPFFLALNDSMDLTLYQNPLSSRGWMQGVEYRHVFSQNDKAIIRYNFLFDKKDDNDFNGDGQTRGNDFRWWFRAKMNKELPFGFEGKIDVDVISDMDYLLEFEDGLTGFRDTDEVFRKVFHRNIAENTDVIRPSIAQITKATEDMFLGFHGRYNDNHTYGERGFTVQTLPSAFLHAFKSRLWENFYYDFDFDYKDYWREQGTKEHRLRFMPGLSMPLDLFDWADLVVAGQLEDTVYVAYGEEREGDRPNDTANKFRYILSADLSKTFARNYSPSWGSLWRHYITPRVRYVFSPHENSDDIPKIDMEDNYEEQNKLVFSILSFVSSKKTIGSNRYSYKDLFRIKLEQSYNFHKEPTFLSARISQPRSLSDLYGEMDIYPLPDLWLRYDTSYNFYGDGFRVHNVRGRYVGYQGSTFDLYYRYHRLVNINELNFDMNAIITNAWSFKFHIKQDFENSKQIESLYGLRYTSNCWAVEGRLDVDSDDTSFLFNLELRGIGDWGQK